MRAVCECGAQLAIKPARGARARKGFGVRADHDLCRRCWRRLQDARRPTLQLGFPGALAARSGS
jgi:hypothetical protein